MASEAMNRWISTYNLDTTHIYPLEKCSCFMFQTKQVIHSGPSIGNEDAHGRLPVFHVWENDREIYCGTNMRVAYQYYRKALNDGLNRSMT